MEGNKHYIRTDGMGRILDGWSDGPNPGRDTAGAVLLREDGGYQFRLYPDGEENPPLTDIDGVHLYQYTAGQVRETTEEEREAERAEILADMPPSAPTMEERVDEMEAAMSALLTGEDA